jgi:hypothetical protein
LLTLKALEAGSLLLAARLHAFLMLSQTIAKLQNLENALQIPLPLLPPLANCWTIRTPLVACGEAKPALARVKMEKTAAKTTWKQRA